MKKYEIIGHCNLALSSILDTIKFIERDSDIEITIVSACTDDFMDVSSGIQFDPGLQLHQTTTETWEPGAECFKIIASVDNIRRRELFSNMEELFEADAEDFNSLIHPLCYYASTVNIGSGVFIYPYSTLGPFSKIGDFTYINSNVNIGHHTIIKDFCTIAPGCNIAGKCLIENNVIIGIGATILDGLKIGDGSFIGAGAVVTKDVEKNSLYYGVPAKFIRKRRVEN